MQVFNNLFFIQINLDLLSIIKINILNDTHGIHNH